MIRLMAWNIEKFGIKSVRPPAIDRKAFKAFFDRPYDKEPSKYIRSLICDVVEYLKKDNTLVLKGHMEEERDIIINWERLVSTVNLILEKELTRQLSQSSLPKAKRKLIEFALGDIASQDPILAACLIAVLDLFDCFMTPNGRLLFSTVRRVVGSYSRRVTGDDNENAIALSEIVPGVIELIDTMVLHPLVPQALLDTVYSIKPDIFVVIEVQDSKGQELGRYEPLKGCGAEAALGLLDIFRTMGEPFVYYCLIPPVRLGGGDNDKEGIAIYYNSAALRFTGPWKWGEWDAKAPIGQGPSEAGDYEPPYMPTSVKINDLLEVGQSLPTRRLNDNSWEHQKTGKLEYKDPKSNCGLLFGRERNRVPVLTEFTDPAGRLIRLLAIHNNHNGLENARTCNHDGVCDIAKISEMVDSRNEIVHIIVGDFNCDAGCNQTRSLTYAKLEEKGYTLYLTDRAFSGTVLARDMIRPDKVVKTLFAGKFPIYDYASTIFDNILTRGVQEGNVRMMIVNRLTGISWERASEKRGYAELFLKGDPNSSELVPTLLDPEVVGKLNLHLEDLPSFLESDPKTARDFYQKCREIRDLSDHLPIVIDF
jgi:hypothetical protein